MTDITSAEALKDHIPGELLRERRPAGDDDIYVEIAVRRARQDELLVPAVPEPMIVWIASGSAVVEERPPGGTWMAVPVRQGDFYLTTSQVPTEMRWRSKSAEPFAVMHVYVALPLLARVVRDVAGLPLAEFALREVSGERDATACGLLALLHGALTAGPPPSDSFVQGMGQALTAHLVQHYRIAAGGRRFARGGLPAYKLHRIIAAMRATLAEPFDLARYARMAELSPFHFSRVFKQATGLAPSRYVQRLRVEEARRLLCETDRSVIDIGLALGYDSPSHFSQVFRRHAGVTPTAYRTGDGR
jgi:AraC family transcriptional regulator